MDISEIITKIRELATAYPQATYEQPSDKGCEYNQGEVHNGPKRLGCIVGQVLPEEWFGTDTFNDHRREASTDLLYGLGVTGLYTDKKSTIEALWVNHVQGRQDRGETWSEAVKDADKLCYPDSV